MGEARRGGRGGGTRGLSRVPHWDKPERQGPVSQEPPAYPGSYSTGSASPLTFEDRKLVTVNRLLVNHWRNSECFVSTQAPRRQVVTFSNRFERDVGEPRSRKDVVVSHCQPEFFPLELLQHKVSFAEKKGSAMSRMTDYSRRQRLKEMEQRESESGHPEPEKVNADAGMPGDSSELEAADDFGGDDYAHDYYADEDFDAHLEEGEDDSTF